MKALFLSISFVSERDCEREKSTAELTAKKNILSCFAINRFRAWIRSSEKVLALHFLFLDCAMKKYQAFLGGLVLLAVLPAALGQSWQYGTQHPASRSETDVSGNARDYLQPWHKDYSELEAFDYVRALSIFLTLCTAYTCVDRRDTRLPSATETKTISLCPRTSSTVSNPWS